MAEGDLNKTITADGSQAVREYVKLQNENQKLKETIRRTTAESKEGGNQFHAMATKGANAAVGWTTSLVSVGTATSLVTQAFADMEKAMQQAATGLNKELASMAKGLTDAGLQAKAPEIEKFLDQMPNVTGEQAQASFFGVTEGGPGLDMDRQKALAEQTARFAAPVGGDLKTLGDVGQLVGRLGDIFPDKTADDIGDIAAAMRGMAGKNIGQLTDPGTLRGLRGLSASGALSDSEAMGFGSLAASKDIGAKTIAGLAEKLTAEMEVIAPQRGKALTSDQLLHNQFAGADASGRLDMLLNDKAMREKILGGQAAMQLGQISREDIRAAGIKFDDAQSGNLLGTLNTDLTKSESGRAALENQSDLVSEDQSDKRIEKDARMNMRIGKALDNALKGADTMDYINGKVLFWANDVFDKSMPEFLGGGDMSGQNAATITSRSLSEDTQKRFLEELEKLNAINAEMLQDQKSKGGNGAASNARNNHRE